MNEVKAKLLEKLQSGNADVGVIGLGYVGLPLAVEFSKHFETIGFDISAARVKELAAGTDSTLEVSDQEHFLHRP